MRIRYRPSMFSRPSRSLAYRAIVKNFTSYSTSPSLITLTDLPSPSTGRIRILSLNRPAARNAISRQLLSELRSHIDNIAAEYTSDGEEVPPQRLYGSNGGVDHRGPTRALILASDVPTCFCAGADLKERAGFSDEETAAFLANLRSTFTNISALPIPTISAISSLALGGGLELALATNFRVLASTSLVAMPETRLGIIPGAGGTYRLPALIGLSRARDLILTGRRISGPEAYFIGIADRLVEVLSDEDGKEGSGDSKILEKAQKLVLSESVRLATEICEGAPMAVRAALEAVQWAREEKENQCYDKVVKTQDRNEALMAFREKRRPLFTGK